MSVRLSVLPQTFAVCRLAPDAAVPPWARHGFVSVTRTPDELSVVCDQTSVPSDVEAERDWHCLAVQGPLPFSMTGVLASLAQPLAEANISIFAISTYDTDYVLVKTTSLEAAVAALRAAGHTVE
jgi:uncharacterized protein